MACCHLSNLPSTMPPSARVYKDDCMFSFDTAENNALGLDVCLTCFQAFARANINYTHEHRDKKNHSVFLNITKTPKPHSEERLPKLAKLEVKQRSETEIFTINHSIYCADCEATLPLTETPPNVQDLADGVVSATSTARNDEIKAWEQEILPCEHSIDLHQTPSSTPSKKCAQCDLSENLWICLHCGAIGCGRQQFGSSLPGNGHALSHFEENNHPVTVKLGSLAENPDSCDCYCYKCNDEVKVPDLPGKLLTFGVDVKNSVKTEKSLVELNLDQNMNWEFKLEGANGEKLDPVFGPGLTGMQNLGNSCYLNSVIQCLFELPQFTKFFSQEKFPDVADAALDLDSQLIKIFQGLSSGRFSKPDPTIESKGDQYQMGVKPSTFKSLIGENHPEFKTQRQQDAFEFLLYVLDKLDSEYDLELTKQFKFLTGTKTLCSSCNHGKLVYELVDNVGVPVEEKMVDGKYEETSLSTSFANYASTESIEGFHCDSCGSKDSIALQSTGFKSFPDVLIVNAKRIKLENWTPVKVDVPIKLEEIIDLSQYKVPEFGPGEVEVKVEASNDFSPDQESMNTLLGMGFSEIRATKGLFNTGNKSAEDAMNWVFAHMDDADIDLPLDVSAASSSEPSAEAVENLMAMGFDAKKAKKALLVNSGDANAAVEWLFSNPDDDGEITETNTANTAKDLQDRLMEQNPGDAQYRLRSVVCHKGRSPHTGHYVAFIHKDGWVQFNDEKVVKCDDVDDIKTNGYVYFFERVKN